MEINKILFKKMNKKMVLFVYFSDGIVRKFKVKDIYKSRLFDLLVDITILDKYKFEE